MAEAFQPPKAKIKPVAPNPEAAVVTPITMNDPGTFTAIVPKPVNVGDEITLPNGRSGVVFRVTHGKENDGVGLKNATVDVVSKTIAQPMPAPIDATIVVPIRMGPINDYTSQSLTDDGRHDVRLSPAQAEVLRRITSALDDKKELSRNPASAGKERVTKPAQAIRWLLDQALEQMQKAKG